MQNFGFSGITPLECSSNPNLARELKLSITTVMMIGISISDTFLIFTCVEFATLLPLAPPYCKWGGNSYSYN
ncbi:unnamed protein product [Tenebrio molitor]|nr:unnamed protein product [Tenebrio molitor]